MTADKIALGYLIVMAGAVVIAAVIAIAVRWPDAVTWTIFGLAFLAIVVGLPLAIACGPLGGCK